MSEFASYEEGDVAIAICSGLFDSNVEEDVILNKNLELNKEKSDENEVEVEGAVGREESTEQNSNQEDEGTEGGELVEGNFITEGAVDVSTVASMLVIRNDKSFAMFEKLIAKENFFDGLV